MVIDFIVERHLRRPVEARQTNYTYLAWRNEQIMLLRAEIERECYIQGFGLDNEALTREALRRLTLIAAA